MLKHDSYNSADDDEDFEESVHTVKSNPLSDSLDGCESLFQVKQFIEMKVEEILMREIDAMLKEHNNSKVVKPSVVQSKKERDFWGKSDKDDFWVEQNDDDLWGHVQTKKQDVGKSGLGTTKQEKRYYLKEDDLEVDDWDF